MLPSGGELLLIILAAFLLFGGKKLREFARTAGKGMRKVQKASRDFQREFNMYLNEDEEPPPRARPKPPELEG
ncbi:MAG: twin-arginine translocase TatA/TatE family subunit [Candidatus Zixiibacteriota bacterium]|nr:MAG: twin-arginine translocase TatA/TatE family subunit [candidate division Zixibacteria bacterium]